MKKAIKWIGIAFVVLIIIGALNSGGKDNQTASNNSTDQAPQAEPAKTYAINELISSENVEVTVTSVAERDAVGESFMEEKASEGATLVVVQWQYKNISKEPLKSYNSPEIKLLDANNVEYGSDLGKTSTYATEVDLDRKVWSDLNPGITVKDAAVFEVGKEAFSTDGWYLNIEVDDKDYKVAL